MITTTKDFNTIREDYSFFETKSTESASDVKAYMPHLATLQKGTEPVRMLDFGCGPGTFTAKFLAQAAFNKKRLHMTLIEPVAPYRAQAISRVQPLTFNPVAAWPMMQPESNTRYNLVLANHVFYYVPDLDAVLGQIFFDLASDGVFLCSVAGRSNVLIQFWIKAFAMIDQPLPHHLSEEVESALKGHREKYEKKEVRYDLVFEDKEEYRLKILRFLMGVYFSAMPRKALLDFFNPYVRDRLVRIPTWHDQYVVKR